METNETNDHDEATSAPAEETSPATGSTSGNDGAHASSNSDEGELYGVLAEFETPGALIKAARKVRDAGYADFDCYSPFPVHGIDEAMGIKRTILPVLVFGGGLTGCFLGFLLQWYCNASAWNWNVAGKPVWSIPANVPIGFETTILLSVFTTFFGMWILNKLPQVWHPFFRLDRFTKVTDDGFMLGIEAKDGRFDAVETKKLLESAGAVAVEECYLDASPANTKMPTFVYGVIICTTALALVPFALVYKARASHSKEPHYHIFSDMDFQAKVKSDQYNDLFPDGRANRGEVTGTIPRGWLNDDLAYAQGLDNGAWITGFPANVEVSRDLLRRGKQRYDIYCTPCHGSDGRGTGMVAVRSQKIGMGILPRNLVDPGTGVITQPNGQLFNTISNGNNTMMGYAAQIPVADRWAIVAYVRALERSQFAAAKDLTDAERSAAMGATP